MREVRVAIWLEWDFDSRFVGARDLLETGSFDHQDGCLGALARQGSTEDEGEDKSHTYHQELWLVS